MIERDAFQTYVDPDCRAVYYMKFANLSSLLQVLKNSLAAPNADLNARLTQIESNIDLKFDRRDWRALRRIAQRGDSVADMVSLLLANMPAGLQAQTVGAYLTQIADTSLLNAIPARLKNVTIDWVLNCTATNLLRRRRRR